MTQGKRTTRRLTSLLLALLLLAGSLPALAEKQSAPMPFLKLVEGVKEHVIMRWPLINTIWPGSDYTRHNLVLFYVDEQEAVQQAWLINTQEARPLSDSETRGLTVPQPGGYAMAKVLSAPSLVMSVDDFSLSQPDAVSETFRTATHELVHFYHQPSAQSQGEGSRAQSYPLQAAPRLYRQMVYQNLIMAAENPAERERALQQARYWQDRWQTEFPQEIKDIRTTDIAEGTAKYIENLGFVIQKDMDQKTLWQKAGALIERDALFPSSDAESYDLGFVACLLLDQTKPGWQADFYQQGKTPVDALLQGFAPLQQEAPLEISKKVTAEIDAINQEAQEDMKDVIKARQDSSIPWLELDVTDTQNSNESRANFLLGQDDVLTGFGAQYRVQGVSLRLKGVSVVTTVKEDGSLLFSLPLTQPHVVKDGHLSVNTDQAQAENLLVTQRQEEGRLVYAAKVTD